MKAGAFDFLKAGIKVFNDWMNRLQKTGQFDAFARDMGETILSAFEVIVKGAGLVADAFRGWNMVWQGNKGTFAAFASWFGGVIGKLGEKLESVPLQKYGAKIQGYWAEVQVGAADALEHLLNTKSHYEEAAGLIGELKAEMEGFRRKGEDASATISGLHSNLKKAQGAYSNLKKAQEAHSGLKKSNKDKVQQEAHSNLKKVHDSLNKVTDGFWTMTHYVPPLSPAMEREFMKQVAGVHRVSKEEYLEILRERWGPWAGFTKGAEEVVSSMSNTFESFRQMARDTAQTMQTYFSDFFFRAMRGELMGFKDVFQSVLTDIQRAVSSMFSKQLVGWLFSLITPVAGASAGGTASATVPKGHRGGVVGAGGWATKTVHPGLFVGAPRLHSGLRPDEFPAILQRGETVIPKGGAPNVTVNIVNQTGTPATAEADQVKFDGRQYVLNVVMEAMQTRPDFRAALGR